MEWNMEENFSMEWNMKWIMEDFWYGMEMEWKKIASMEYGKIVFHSIPCPGFYSVHFAIDPSHIASENDVFRLSELHMHV